MADQIHIPTLLARKLGISTYLANAICAEAVLSLDDVPIPIVNSQDRFWLPLEDSDWGKKLTLKGRTSTYVVQVDRVTEDDDYSREP